MKDTICEDFCEKKKKCEDLEVNMTGWSRGATIVLGVAKELKNSGCKCGGFLGFGGERFRPVEVNWIGLFDAVEMVLDATRVLLGDQGFPSYVPDNVKHFAHAIKTDTTSMGQRIFPTTYFGWNERAFMNYDGSLTTHNDIGNSRSLGDNNLAYIWIKIEAERAGVEF